MTYVTRATEAIKQIHRFDSTGPSNAELDEMGQAALYHPNGRGIWGLILTQNSLVINPANESVLDDIGTVDASDPPVFTPSSAGTKKAAIANQFNRLTRRQWKDWLKAHRLRITSASAEPLSDARATILTNAETDGSVIVGDDTDDPQS